VLEGHGCSGPLNLTKTEPDDLCGVAVLKAAAAVGRLTVRFNKGTTVTDGAGFFHINRFPHGTCALASVSYLHPIIDVRPNLKVLTSVWASRVLCDSRRAT
jgi:choline dehydrogenase